jgi:methionyl-tRNA formyltransferase
MRIVYMGSPAFATIPLRSLVQAGFNVVAVVTQPDRPAGRSRTPVAPPVKVVAEELGIEVFQPASLRDPEAIEHFAAFKADVGVVAAYGEILRKKVLAIPPLGFLNIHPSLLPRFRGPTPVVSALLAGDQVTGVSVMRLDAGMDTGPLLAQREVALKGDERGDSLTEALFELGSQMLVEVLPAYASGSLQPVPQAEEGVTITKMLTKEDGIIDWTQSAAQIERAVRAFDPWPGTSTTWGGQNVKIVDVRVAAGTSEAAPGSVIASRSNLLVATGSGILEITLIQPAGKRAMDGSTWLRGQQNLAGKRFGEPSA